MKPLATGAGAHQPFYISDQNNIRVLAANTVETVSIPTGAKFMMVQSTAVAVFLFDADPPNVADLADGTAGQMINPNSPPLLIEIPLPATNVRFNAPGAATVGVSFYGKQ